MHKRHCPCKVQLLALSHSCCSSCNSITRAERGMERTLRLGAMLWEGGKPEIGWFFTKNAFPSIYSSIYSSLHPSLPTLCIPLLLSTAVQSSGIPGIGRVSTAQPRLRSTGLTKQQPRGPPGAPGRRRRLRGAAVTSPPVRPSPGCGLTGK